MSSITLHSPKWLINSDLIESFEKDTAIRLSSWLRLTPETKSQYFPVVTTNKFNVDRVRILKLDSLKRKDRPKVQSSEAISRVCALTAKLLNRDTVSELTNDARMPLELWCAEMTRDGLFEANPLEQAYPVRIIVHPAIRNSDSRKEYRCSVNVDHLSTFGDVARQIDALFEEYAYGKPRSQGDYSRIHSHFCHLRTLQEYSVVPFIHFATHVAEKEIRIQLRWIKDDEVLTEPNIPQIQLQPLAPLAPNQDPSPRKPALSPRLVIGRRFSSFQAPKE